MQKNKDFYVSQSVVFLLLFYILTTGDIYTKCQNASLYSYKTKRLKYSSKFEKLVNRQKKHKPNRGSLGIHTVKIW